MFLGISPLTMWSLVGFGKCHFTSSLFVFKRVAFSAACIPGNKGDLKLSWEVIEAVPWKESGEMGCLNTM